MAKITKKVELQYVAKGLDTIQKQIEKLREKSKVSDFGKDVEKEISKLLSYVSSLGDDASLNTIKAALKDFQKVLQGFEKARTGLYDVIDDDSATQIKFLNEEILKKQEEIEQKEKEIKRLEREIKNEADTSIKSAGTKTKQRETLQEAYSNISTDGEGPELKSFSGRDMKDVDAWVQKQEELYKILLDTEKVTAEVIEKIKTGKDLTDEEQKTVKEAIELYNSQQERSGKIRLDQQDIAEQAKIRLDIEKEQQKILEKEWNILEGIKDEVKTIKEQRDLDLEEKAKIEAESAEWILREGEEEEKELVDELNKSRTTFVELLGGSSKEIKKLTQDTNTYNEESKKTVKVEKEKETTMGKAVKQVFAYGTAYKFLQKIYKETIRTVRDLDKALTGMTVVTGISRKEAWNLVPALQEIGKNTGMVTTEIAALTTEYLRQGRVLKDALKLAEVTAKAAKIAGISASDSVNYLTAAINGFGLAAKDAMEVSDKFAAVAASSASSYEELAVGMSKFAAQARVAGISMDFAMGMLAKGVETTREAPETIGTAIKTVLSRMRELTDYGKTLEDGLDINRVEGALRQVGIRLRDANGEFRSMEDVLTEVGTRWDTLNKTQQASVAVALAGTRQQSRLIAMMNDFDRTLQLVQTSQESAGATNEQHAEYMKGMEAAMTNLQNAWQKFITTITESEVIVGVVRTIGDSLNWVSDVLNKFGPIVKNTVIGIAALVAVLKAYKIIQGLVNTEAIVSVAIGKIFNKVKSKQAILDGLNTFATWANAKALKIKNKEQQKSNALGVASIPITLGQAAAAGTGGVTYLTFAGALKGATKAMWNLTVAMLANPIGAIIAAVVAIAALTVGIILLVNNLPNSTKAFNKQREAIQKVRKESQKLVSSLDDLINKYDEINSKSIKTDEDIEALKNLEEELKNIEGLKIEYNPFTGEMDTDATLENLRQMREEEQEKIKKSFEDEKKAAEKYLSRLDSNAGETGAKKKKQRTGWALGLTLFSPVGAIIGASMLHKQAKLDKAYKDLDDKEFKEFLKKEGYKTEEIKAMMEERTAAYGEIRKSFTNFYINEFKMENGGKLTSEQQKDLEDFYDSMLSVERLKTIQEGGLDAKLLEEELKDLSDTFIKEQEKVRKKLADSRAKGFEQELKAFREEKERIEALIRSAKGVQKEAYEALLASMEENNKALVYFDKAFKDFTDEIPKIFEGIDWSINDINKLGQAAQEAGYDIASILELVAKKTKKYTDQGLSDTEAQNKAWAEVAGSIEDAGLKAQLFSFAAGRGLLEISQAIDKISNSMKSLTETQQKFLEGSLSMSETYDFFENHPEILEDAELFYKFLNGQDVTLGLINAKLKKREEYEQNLQMIQAQIRGLDRNAEDYDQQLAALQVEERRIIAMMQFRGVLRNVTQEQYNFNTAIQQYTLLSKYSIDSSEAMARALQNIGAAAAKTALKGISELNSLLNEFEIDGLNGEWSDYFTIIDGVLVANTKMTSQLTSTQLQALEDWREGVQNTIEGQLDAIQAYKEQELKIEKEKVAKQKKIYEDYFKAIDKLEEKRLRKQDRDSIIKQLQRLEGATDERSRQKALDLRKQLNDLDEKSAEEERKEAREALMASFDDRLVEIEEKWNNVMVDFLDVLTEGGDAIGNSILDAFVNAGMVTREKADQIKNSTNIAGGSGGPGAQDPNEELTDEEKTERRKNYLESLSVEEIIRRRELDKDHEDYISSAEVRGLSDDKKAEINTIKDNEAREEFFKELFAGVVTYAYKNREKHGPSSYYETIDYFREQFKGFSTYELKGLYKPWDRSSMGSLYKKLKGAGMTYDGGSAGWHGAAEDSDLLKWYTQKTAAEKNNLDSKAYKDIYGRLPAFKKGGLVDYTGLAMVHGSDRNPEMVLSADQTKMFMGLRDTLEAGGTAGGINIGAINIQTNELNNAQDFGKAGRALAAELQKAITRRGITINTKR